MKLFDFSKRFSRVAAWMNQNSGKMKPEEMEEKLPDLYIQWLNTPAAWLDGDSPNTYFNRFTDAKQLTGMLVEYCRADVPVPDPLSDRLAALGEETAPLLARLLLNPAAPEKSREAAGSILIEIGGRMPVNGCIGMILADETPASLKEQAAAVLRAAGRNAEEALLNAAENARDDARSMLLDVLLDCSRDERILNWILYELNNHPDSRTAYISYLLRLGDERALQPLTDMLTLTDLGYVDFLEISNAIESLGGEVNVQREFAGDEEYEAMRIAGMEPETEPDFGIDLETKPEDMEQKPEDLV